MNWFDDRRSPWEGASVERVRLRDYGAREVRDTAAVDPKGLGRVAGPTAKALAHEILVRAAEILVEFKGIDDRGRSVCWLWVEGHSLGQLLEQAHAVAPTSTIGAGST